MFSILPKQKLARTEALWFWFFISPWIIGLILFRGGPILGSLFLSFTEYNVADPPVWVNLENYQRLLSDDIFYKSLQVSGLYTLLAVPLGIVVSLVMALLLNQKGVPFLGVFRTPLLHSRPGGGQCSRRFPVPMVAQSQFWHYQLCHCPVGG